MSSPIRQDLVVPYHHIPAVPRSEASGMIAQTLPMAAMFMRNKMLSWTALFLAIQSFLNEPLNKPPVEQETQSQPPSLRIVFALVSLATCYVEIFFPASSPALKRAAKTAEAAATGK